MVTTRTRHLCTDCGYYSDSLDAHFAESGHANGVALTSKKSKGRSRHAKAATAAAQRDLDARLASMFGGGGSRD